jgi:pyruvate,orthophosphate dikinase
MPWENGLELDDILTLACPGAPAPEATLERAGGKAFNLMKLAGLGFPVPPGFVLPAAICGPWIAKGAPDLAEFRAAIARPLEYVERAAELRFGDPHRPMLVSVRSGAAVSMPGMLDTVLDIGLTRATLPGLVAMTGNPRLAWDCYLRLILSYAATVHNLDSGPFDALVNAAVTAAGAAAPVELDTLSLRELALSCAGLFEDLAGMPFPEDPFRQLLGAVDAVFRSWNSQRAVSYRRLNGLDGIAGTAVTVQRMVYGNAGPNSGAGVGFTRDPATGENRLYVDFAFDAQGEDVVSGRQPLTPVNRMARLLPDVMEALEHARGRLEKAFGDVQDFEFTVEEGKLFLLQTRSAKRSSWAKLKFAVDLAEDGLIDRQEALHRLEGLDLSSLVRRSVACGDGRVIASGVAAGMGVATGAMAATIDAARAMAADGRDVILVRNDISTDDIDAIACAVGVLTARGGRTSHAAVVARELGKVAIVGCRQLQLAEDGKSCTIAGHHFGEGDEISLDGESGRVFAGPVEMLEERPTHELAVIEGWKNCLNSTN